MSTIVEPFSHDTDFFTEFGNDDVNAKFKWQGGKLRLTKLIKGWDLAGLVQTDSIVLSSLDEFFLRIKLVTNVIGNPQASDENSTTMLNLIASNSSLGDPDLSTATYGFVISGGKAAIQNSFDGAQVFDALTQGEIYEIMHVIEADGRMAVYCDGDGQPGFLGYVKNSNNTYPDFRGYNARFNFQPYYTDILEFIHARIRF